VLGMNASTRPKPVRTLCGLTFPSGHAAVTWLRANGKPPAAPSHSAAVCVKKALDPWLATAETTVMDIKRTLSLALLALASTAASAACDSYTVLTTPLADVPVETQARSQLPNQDFMGYMTARPAVVANETACTVSLTYDTTVIYIAKDVAASECARAHVLAHELGHAAIYNRSLAALHKTSSKTSSLDGLIRDIRESQMAHDTPEEYETNLNVCGKKMRQFVRGRR
jgi:hypothetical protein